MWDILNVIADIAHRLSCMVCFCFSPDHRAKKRHAWRNSRSSCAADVLSVILSLAGAAMLVWLAFIVS